MNNLIHKYLEASFPVSLSNKLIFRDLIKFVFEAAFAKFRIWKIYRFAPSQTTKKLIKKV